MEEGQKVNIDLESPIDVKSSDDYAVLYKADGEEGDITDISVDSVIAIYDSAPYTANQSKKIIRVVENEISGTISSLKKNGDIIIVDGVEYFESGLFSNGADCVCDGWWFWIVC